MSKKNSYYDYEERWKELEQYLIRQMNAYDELNCSEKKCVKQMYQFCVQLHYRFFTRNHLEE